MMLKKFTIVLVFFFSVIFFFKNNSSPLYEFITYRFANIHEDRGSGRFDVYSNVLKLQSQLPFEHWILGSGHNAVIEKNYILSYQVSAHNDFLEVLYDYGILALIVYILMHFFLVKRILQLYRQKSNFFISYLVSYIIFFFLSMFSHLILYNTYFIYLAIYWGSVEAILQKRKEVNFNKSNNSIRI